MRIRGLITAAVAAAICGSAAVAADPAPAPKEDPSKKIVCKTERFVGSRISNRICKTRAEWEQGKADAKDALDRSLRGPGRDPTPVTGG